MDLSFLTNLEVAERVDRLEVPFNREGIDPYGVSKRELVLFFSMLTYFYRDYFGVRVSGLEHLPKRGRGMLIGNHSGGVALDAAMVLVSTLLEMEPPRLLQGMVEKFLGTVPFANSWLSRTGQFAGLPENAARLLEDERLLVVFPEGARGTAKLYWQRDSLVGFGTGFMRLALATKTPIIPFAFIGGGDAIPTVMNLYTLGRLLGAPYIPVTPWLLPIPRRVPLSIHYGEPMHFEGSSSEEDSVVEGYVEKVKDRIAELIAKGRAQSEART